MRLVAFNRHALAATSSAILAALLGACATSSNMGTPGSNDSGLRFGQTSKQTFKFTGGEQEFTVPAGVTEVAIIASGARGSEGVGDGASGGKYDPPGGLGGRVTATITVKPGENLAIFVGGMGRRRGFNGGGTGSGRFGRGGGASDVRQGGTSLSDRVVVAGGGGGGGAVGYCESTSCGYGAGGEGGIGGGRDGGSGGNGHGYLHGAGGSGGTQRDGGSGGTGSGSGCDGATGTSGAGGAGKRTCGGFGGGGGGGYFGGGGGGGGGREGSSSGSGYFGPGGGGGGGSSFAEKSAIDVHMLPGVRAGDGLISISW
jgi:hypothetical protein